MQRGDRRRVVDDALERRRQPDQLAQPAEGDFLQLRGRRRRAPQHRLHVEAGGEHLREHAGAAGADREVGEEPRMVPVRQAWNDDLFEVREDAIERLARTRAPGPAARRARRPGSRATARDTGPGGRSSRRASRRRDALVAERFGIHVTGVRHLTVLRQKPSNPRPLPDLRQARQRHLIQLLARAPRAHGVGAAAREEFAGVKRRSCL